MHTPLVESPQLNAGTGARVLIKAESSQLSGKFKMLGALNKALTLTPAELSAGLIAFSTGNHGREPRKWRRTGVETQKAGTPAATQ